MSESLITEGPSLDPLCHGLGLQLEDADKMKAPLVTGMQAAGSFICK